MPRDIRLYHDRIFLFVALCLSAGAFVLVLVMALLLFRGSSPWSLSSPSSEELNSAVVDTETSQNVENVATTNPAVSAQTPDDDIQKILQAVTKHFVFPDGDVTIATVMDADGLRLDNPLLFERAKKGDNLLYFSLGLIIYDPVQDKIVDFFRITE